MNITFALKNTSRGRIAYADIDFSSIGYSGAVLNKNYFSSGGSSVVQCFNTLTFPQITNVFSVKGLRYFYRPFWAISSGDIANLVAPIVNVPSVFIYNNANNDTEVVGLSRTDFDNFWDSTIPGWVSRILTLVIVGGANFESEFQDSIDVLSIITTISGSPATDTGRIQLQFTEFELGSFSKSVSIDMTAK